MPSYIVDELAVLGARQTQHASLTEAVPEGGKLLSHAGLTIHSHLALSCACVLTVASAFVLHRW